MNPLITTVYMPSPVDITDRLLCKGHLGKKKGSRRIAEHIQMDHPLAYLTFEEAENAALMAAPAAESAEEWADLIDLATALGGGLPDQDTPPPAHVSFILKVAITDLKVVEISEMSKTAHLAFGAEHPEVEALLLPEWHDPRSGALRLIAQEKFKRRRLRFIDSSRVPARTRPLA